MSTEPPFELSSCRQLFERYPGSISLKAAVSVIEQTVHTDPGVAFTHCRGLLETVCISILTDRGIDIQTHPKPNYLMKKVTKELELAPITLDDEHAESGVSEILRGLNSLVNGVVLLRKGQGTGPHGRDALAEALPPEYAILTARAVDMAVGFLYRIHQKQLSHDPAKRLRLGSHPNFDEYIDQAYLDILIEDAPILASIALYNQDIQAYRQSLVEFLGHPTVSEPEISEGESLSESDYG